MSNSRARNSTYADKIVCALSNHNRPLQIEEIMEYMNIEPPKISYIIDGLKNLIAKGVVQKNENINEKRLYLGHIYMLLY
jgi:hypothetical protein